MFWLRNKKIIFLLHILNTEVLPFRQVELSIRFDTNKPAWSRQCSAKKFFRVGGGGGGEANVLCLKNIVGHS